MDAYMRNNELTHWGRVTHICVSKLSTIGSDNGVSPGRRQAIIWTNVGILLIRPLGTNFSEILSEIHTFSFKKMHLKMSSAKWRPFCLGLNVLTYVSVIPLWPHCMQMFSKLLTLLRGAFTGGFPSQSANKVDILTKTPSSNKVYRCGRARIP